jgi:class 3 adenylate cyclase/tetratricopeptide (TPR) repeat protein
MNCPKCHTENPENKKFCRKCGEKLPDLCPKCSAPILPGDGFCGECGHELHQSQKPPEIDYQQPRSYAPKHQAEEILTTRSASDGERKYVSVLFSDLTGYTSMSEKLDPEEVKEITCRIFGEISKIVATYDGFIEKYVGDAVMAIFGVPNSHEDDPIRAIKAAREIHQVVDAISPEIEKKIGRSISMHSGINTGLVVTGEVNMERGTHGVAGDTINLAARLSSLAKPGQILIDGGTCRQVEGHFECEFVKTTTVKGKSEPVQVNLIVTERDKPITIHRLSGVRAELIGRKMEMSELHDAVERLQQGKGSIFSIYGAAGTGKSRLSEEFKAGLDLNKIQWVEAHAYAYSQNISYFPLIDFLNRILDIDEKDVSEKVKQKIESGMESLLGNIKDDVIPYLGRLYSLSYPQVENVSPEFWKSRLQAAVLEIFSAIAARAPTVFFMEDLHWADPSFMELIRRSFLEILHPAIVICTYRPTLSLFTGQQKANVTKYYHEILLENLSLSDAQSMLESLLKTESIPSELKRWVQNKAEGNPFYLEELINSLIESDWLVQDSAGWKLIGTLTESDIPSSLHGIISGRLDRLEKQTKRILQEASVIGRDFLYEILKRISELKERIDGELNQLERLDLIRTRSFQPDLEYMFKHALTQEIVYNGLLKKHRKQIHEQIAQVMENLFKDRLSEFHETLAFHYVRGNSQSKAVDYLLKSGKKCLERYAAEEAHQYFGKAYEIITSKGELTETDKITLIDILNNWGHAFYYLGIAAEFLDRFKSHEAMADSLDDKDRKGMFYVWFGIALLIAGRAKNAYDYLIKGLELGEATGNQKVIGYACARLTWLCGEMGLMAEGIDYGEKAQKLSELFPFEQHLFYDLLGGLSYIYNFIGNTNRVLENAKRLLEYGKTTSNNMSVVFGHWVNSFANFTTGDFETAQKNSKLAIEAAPCPIYAQAPKVILGYSLFFAGDFEKAEKVLKECYFFSEEIGYGHISIMCQIGLSAIFISKGQMQQGFNLLENAQNIMIINQRRSWYAVSEHILGEIYAQLATGKKPSLSIMAKNIGFLMKNVPFAAKKAEEHFNKAIELTKEIGGKGFLGPIYLGLAKLYKATKRTEQATQSLLEAIKTFEECEAETYLKQANELLASLK